MLRSCGRLLNAGIEGTRTSAWYFLNEQEILESDTLTDYGARVSLKVWEVGKSVRQSDIFSSVRTASTSTPLFRRRLCS